MLHLYLTPADDFWLAATVLWIGFSVAMLHRYTAALRAARIITDADVRTLGCQIMRDFIRAESFRLAGHIASIVVGVTAATIVPTPVNLDARLVNGIVALGLIFINCMQGANSINAYVSWRHRERLLDARRNRREAV